MGLEDGFEKMASPVGSAVKKGRLAEMSSCNSFCQFSKKYVAAPPTHQKDTLWSQEGERITLTKPYYSD